MFPDLYSKGFKKIKKQSLEGFIDSRVLSILSHTDEECENNEERKNDEKVKKASSKRVIIVNVDTNCILRPESAFFIHRLRKKSLDDEEEDEDELLYKRDVEKEDLSDTWILPKDLEDLKMAAELDIDSVALSDIHKASDVKEYQRVAQDKKASFKIIAKIQNKDAVDNFSEIAKAADGIMLSRSYLAVHMPPEKFFFTQKQLISTCNRMGKPVFVIGQMLESMCSSIIPTTSEINDVSNLVLSNCDSVGLVKEIIWGKYPIDSLRTLDKICWEAEQQIQTLEDDDESLDRPYKINENIPIVANPKGTSISAAIVHCVAKAVYETKSPLVICFSQTGATVLKLSKLPCPCPILAVVSDEKIARQCSLLASVVAFKVGSMMGTESLIPRVLNFAKEAKLARTNDLVVISFGEVDGIPGVTNSLKIIKVT